MKKRLTSNWLNWVPALTVTLLAVGSPALADSLDGYAADDMATVNTQYRMNQIMESRRLALLAVNGPYIEPHVPHNNRRPSPPYTGPDVVERWRPLVEIYFNPGDVEWALRIVACESGGYPNAKNPTSSASGLFQHLARYWDGRSKTAGWAGASIWDPEANIAVAAWLLGENGKASWECKA